MALSLRSPPTASCALSSQLRDCWFALLAIRETRDLYGERLGVVGRCLQSVQWACEAVEAAGEGQHWRTESAAN